MIACLRNSPSGSGDDVDELDQTLRAPGHVQAFDVLERLQARDHVGAVGHLDVARDRSQLGVREVADTPPQRIGRKLRVAVYVEHEVAHGYLNARVERRRLAAVRFLHEFDRYVPILADHLPGDVTGFVGRAVVDDHDFVLGIVLLEQRLNRGAEQDAFVIDRHDNRNHWRPDLALFGFVVRVARHVEVRHDHQPEVAHQQQHQKQDQRNNRREHEQPLPAQLDG